MVLPWLEFLALACCRWMNWDSGVSCLGGWDSDSAWLCALGTAHGCRGLASGIKVSAHGASCAR